MTGGSEPIAWLTVNDVARMLDLKPKTIYILASEACPESRRLPSHRLGPRGGKLRFLAEDVADYIRASRTVVNPTSRPLKHLTPRVAGSHRRHG
jgi:hypothetical protein